MANNLNAKVVFEAETKDLTRGAKQATQDMKDFGKTSNEVVSSIGDAFGVNTQKLEQMGNSARDLGRRLQESGNTGVAALGKLLQSIDAVKVGIAGLGIGAAVSAFKLLNAEAENFRSTVAGARMDTANAAYIETYTQVLHDLNAETGKNVATFNDKWTEAIARFKANFSSNVVGVLSGAQGFGSMGEILAVSALGNSPQERLAKSSAEEAKKLAGEIYDIQRQIAEKAVDWKNTEAEIAELRRVAKDDSAGLATQSAAIARAHELVTQRYDEEAKLLAQVAERTAAISKLAEDSVPAHDAMLAAEGAAAEVLRTKEATLKGLERDQRSINKLVSQEAAARAEAAAFMKQIADQAQKARAEMEASHISPGSSGSLTGKATTDMQVTALIRPVVDKEEVKKSVLELSSAMASGVSDMASTIGSLVGDLATGENAWRNFASNAVSSLGDMAISVGKMAIATGLATEGIKTALKSLNGYVAIAAGAALVALGSAVKSGLSNIAGGNYTASASVAAPTYGRTGAQGGGYATSAINVSISGKLTASGTDLALVLSKENMRRNTTT